MSSVVHIYNETSRKKLPKAKIKKTIENVLSHFGKSYELNIVFVDEERIRELNRNYLKHDYVTDVISFDLSDENVSIGEVYVCIEQAERQAKEYRVSFESEILRLAIHGVLHILGFDDNTIENQNEMHKLEDNFLQ